MKKREKNIKLILISFFILLFLTPLIYSAQVVQVAQEEQQPVKETFFSKYFGFFKSPIFWWIIAGLVFIIAIIIGLVFLVRWLVKYLKTRSDIFWQLRNERIKLAKIHRRYPSTHFLKVSKNIPIRLVKKENEKLIVSEPIAYHRGDYTSNEGNLIISLNMRFDKRWLFLPITSLLVVPNREKVKIMQKNEKGKQVEIEINNLPQAKDIVQFNESEILIFAESLSSVGQFLVPVLKAKDGKIIDLALPTYQSLREVILGDFLYSQTDDFVKVAKKTMDLNPNLRFSMKSNDASQSVEIPQGGQGR
jgi:hypothetical protein